MEDREADSEEDQSERITIYLSPSLKQEMLEYKKEMGFGTMSSMMRDRKSVV